MHKTVCVVHIVKIIKNSQKIFLGLIEINWHILFNIIQFKLFLTHTHTHMKK